LAAALIQLAHARAGVKPIFQMLIYPMLDDRTSLRAGIGDSKRYIWTNDSNRFGWKAYLGKKYGAGETVPEYAAPSRRDDLSGLPPAWIGVGTIDLFHDEDVAYAQRLRDCGVECEMEIVPGAFHGFDAIAPKSQVAQDFRSSQIAALKKYLSPEVII
jgi:acetyl esterase/lipase